MPRLTKSFIDKLDPAEKKQLFYRDDILKGFGLRISAGGSKAFFVEKRIDGKVKRITLGKYGALTAEQARKKAQSLLGEIAMGKDPHEERRVSQLKKITLEEAFEDYLYTRKDLKDGTIGNYRKCVNGCFKDWKHKQLTDISKDMVQIRHHEIGQRAPARANNAFRVLRLIFNHALNKYEDKKGNPLLLFNPVDRLSQNRAWYKNERRQTLLKPHQLKPWYEATLMLNQEVTRDYLHFLLFTGLRKTEAASLVWANVDFIDRTFTIEDTKNSEAHTLPMSDYLFDLLMLRASNGKGDYVFPSPINDGPLKEPRSSIKRVNELSGIAFTCHDLRRTFITVAESLDIPAYALKKLINHKDPNDVTAGYIISNIDRLREPMNKISTWLLSQATKGE